VTATEVRQSTRSGAIGLTGAAVNGAFGFVLTTVVLRTFGADGSGALFSVIAVVTIAAAVCCLGADTALLWALPRRPGALGRLLRVALLPVLVSSLVIAVAGALAAEPVGRVLLDDPASTTLVRLAFAGVPVIVVSTVLLAVVRATRPAGTYVAVQLVFVPIARPVLMIGTVALGGGVLLGFAGWLLPPALAALIAVALIAGPVHRPEPADWRSFWSFALPRAASMAIDSSSMWVGVLLTSALAGQTEAGVFAAVGRYALAGLLVMQGLRVAVAPHLSRLLGADRRAEAAEVYRRTTLAIIVLSWPAYLLLAVFARAFLAVFGSDFGGGAVPLAVLAAAMLINVGVGLVQTVLLMSGNSRRHLVATVAGLALNLLAAVLLIPAYGALGAAIAWSLGIVAENVLAAVFARRALGEPLFSAVLLRVTGAVVAATGLAAAIGVLVAGRGPAGLAVTLVVAAVGCLAALASPTTRARLGRIVRSIRKETP
jgi:O-antigen/teichoic acid export membrane protein